jgi:uncharacterized membrane protein
MLLPVLVGWIGLVLDSGLIMAAHRQTQNAADAAATAAAYDLLKGRSTITAYATAKTFVQTYNGLSQASVTLNIPPHQGPYAGNVHYAEAIITNPVHTWFIQVLGAARNRTTSARAVASYQPVAKGAGGVPIDPTADPGQDVYLVE